MLRFFFLLFWCISNFYTFSQTKFNPIIQCYVNDELIDRFKSQDQSNLELKACFHTKSNKFIRDSIRITIDTNSLPNGYKIGDFDIEWKIEGIGFYETPSIKFKPIETGGYFLNLLLLSKDKNFVGKNKSKLKFSSIPKFTAFNDFPDSICMDQHVKLPFMLKDGRNISDPITLNKLSFSMGGLNKVLTDLPDAPSGSFAQYESTINIDDYGTNSIIKSPKDINQVCLSIEHSSLIDLEMLLECPNGTRIVLLNSFSGNEGKDLVPGGFKGKDVGLGNDLDEIGVHGNPAWQYCFSTNKSTFGTMGDEYMLQNFKLNIVNNLSMNPEGIYLPEETFEKLIGCPVKGNWKIIVQDNQYLDDGYIFNWGIMFNSESFPVLDTYQNSIQNQYWDNKLAIVQSDSILTITPKKLGANDFRYTIKTDFNCIYDTVLHIGTKLCISIPNIVCLSSKNGNDKFFVNTGDIKKFKLEIFDRWENSIFVTEDLNQAWDGKTTKGKIVEQGNYYYIVDLEYNNGESYTKKGTFLLLH